jgi:glycosyltransferase involved in cell wall biosynthesis
MNDLKFSILVTTYNGAEVIGETLKSILSQSFANFEIIVNDNASTDDTEKIARSFQDNRIKFFQNWKNLGYPGNLAKAFEHSSGEIIYLMGQDDILGTDALLNTYRAFKSSDDIGAVTRPYFWFDEKIEKPVRAKDQLDPTRDEIVKITDDPRKIVKVFETVDQLSGLAFRRRFMDIPFHPDIFTCHIYPFASIFKKHPVVFLKDYNLAVRIATSMSRTKSSVYEKSPLQSWVEMFESILNEEKLHRLKRYMIKNFVATNYVGLVQIRNYAKYKYLLREIWYLLKYRWQNVVSPSFWFFSLGTMITPAFILIPMADWYKNKINSKKIKHIEFEYKL